MTAPSAFQRCLLQLTAGGGDRLPGGPAVARSLEAKGGADPEQFGASQLGRRCSRRPGSYLDSREGCNFYLIFIPREDENAALLLHFFAL